MKGVAEEALMKLLFGVGLLLIVLGIASFFIPIPRNERKGLKADNVDIGVEVRHNEHVSPIVSTVLVVAGAGMMIAGSRGGKRA
jgi:hypothetical protein